MFIEVKVRCHVKAVFWQFSKGHLISLLKAILFGISLKDFDIWHIMLLITFDFNFNFRNPLNTVAGWDSMDLVIIQTPIFKQ